MYTDKRFIKELQMGISGHTDQNFKNKGFLFSNPDLIPGILITHFHNLISIFRT